MALLLVGVLAVGGCSGKQPTKPVNPALTSLDTAVHAVATTRASLLAAADAVQSAASQLDRTDELCAAGSGSAARASFRTSLPLTLAARKGRTGLTALVTSYSQSLDRLRTAARTGLLRPAERSSLDAVVRDGRAEAAAFERFRVSLTTSWPAYDQLSADEDVWSSHAVSGWYRTTKEAAAAYSVLVQPRRAALDAARSRLASAASTLEEPTTTQTATLRKADAALDRLRGPAP